DDDRLHDAVGVGAAPAFAVVVKIIDAAAGIRPFAEEDFLAAFDGPEFIELLCVAGAEVEEGAVAARIAVIERAPEGDKEGNDQATCRRSPVNLLNGFAVGVTLEEQGAGPKADGDYEEQQSKNRDETSHETPHHAAEALSALDNNRLPGFEDRGFERALPVWFHEASPGCASCVASPGNVQRGRRGKRGKPVAARAQSAVEANPELGIIRALTAHLA